jgi:uncharacterized protein
MKSATMCYVEIPSPSLEKAKTFYSKVFGWAVSDSSMPNYSHFEAGESGMSGGFDPNLSVQDGGVIFYLGVGDIPGSLKTVQREGGSVLQEKTAVGPNAEFGYLAIARDPNGNRGAIRFVSH